MGDVTLKTGPSRIWAHLYRTRFLRAPMPFWRVVVEAKLDRRARRWPSHLSGAVGAVFVWARTIEEAEALAVLAMEDEGLRPVTADAKKCAPSARPSRVPRAVAKTQLGFIAREEEAEPVWRETRA